jgi:hypothetical protein
MNKKQEIEQLKGIAKILDCLWEDSYNVRKMDERIKKELIYFFGENWATDMYKFANMKSTRPIMPRPLKELDNLFNKK